MKLENITEFEDRDRIHYSGGLRNERKFELLQRVFLVTQSYIVPAKVIGKELLLGTNSSYIYKLELPDDFAEYGRFILEGYMDCSDIYDSIEQAKESAIDQTNHLHKCRLETIERFFDQYIKEGND